MSTLTARRAALSASVRTVVADHYADHLAGAQWAADRLTSSNDAFMQSSVAASFARTSARFHVQPGGAIGPDLSGIFSLDYDLAGLPLGALLEGTSTNTVLQSSRFDQGTWTKNRTAVTLNAATSPDGASNGSKLVASSGTAASHIMQSNGSSLASGSPVTVSIYAKAAELSWIGIGPTNQTNAVAFFNLATGAVGTVQSAVTSARMVPAGNGWYRCIVTMVANTTVSTGLLLFLCSADNTTSFAGDGTSGVYLYGGQCEFLPVVTSPIATSGTSTPRASDLYLFGPTFATPLGPASGLPCRGFAQGAGSMVEQFDTDSDGAGTFTIWSLYSDASNYIELRIAAGAYQFIGVSGGTTQWNITGGSYAARSVVTAHAAWVAGRAELWVNGVRIGAATPVTIPTVATLAFFRDRSGANPAYGHSRRHAYVAAPGWASAGKLSTAAGWGLLRRGGAAATVAAVKAALAVYNTTYPAYSSETPTITVPSPYDNSGVSSWVLYPFSSYAYTLHNRGSWSFAFEYPGSTNANNDFYYPPENRGVVAFRHTGTSFAFRGRSGDRLAVVVDGKPLSGGFVTVPSASGYSTVTTKFVFGSSATRNIVIFANGFGFGGLFAPSSDKIAPYPLSDFPSARFMTDSYGTLPSVDWTSGPYWEMGIPLGLFRFGIDPVGGSGYIAAGSGTPFFSRQAALLSGTPQITGVFGGINDPTADGSGRSIQSYAADLFTYVRSQNPNTILLVGASWYQPALALTGARQKRDFIKAALTSGAAAVGSTPAFAADPGPWVFLDTIDCTWSNSAGATGTFGTSPFVATGDVSDGTHLTVAAAVVKGAAMAVGARAGLLAL